MKTYPLLMLFARHGRRMAYGLLAAGLVATLFVAWLSGSGSSAALVLGGTLLAGLATRLAAEVIEVLAETLIPR